MDRLFTYFEYWKDNPPIGALYKQVVEAKYGNKKGNVNKQCHDNRNWHKPTFKNDEERLKWEENQLSELIQIFGGSGGIVRKGKKGGK